MKRTNCANCCIELTDENGLRRSKVLLDGSQPFRKYCRICNSAKRKESAKQGSKKRSRASLDIVSTHDELIRRAINAQRSIFKTTLLVAA